VCQNKEVEGGEVKMRTSKSGRGGKAEGKRGSGSTDEDRQGCCSNGEEGGGFLYIPFGVMLVCRRSKGGGRGPGRQNEPRMHMNAGRGPSAVR